MTLVFEDDFDTLDTDVWTDNPWRTNVDPDTYTVTGSVLTVRWDSGMTNNLGEVAALGTRAGSAPFYPDAKSYQGGYFEARIRFTDDAGCWPAFWMLSHAHANSWPTQACPNLHAEWDIMENSIGGTDPRNIAVMNVHRNSSAGYCGEAASSDGVQSDLTGNNLSDWHVWGGLWKDGLLVQYLDGKPVGVLAAPDSFDQPLYLLFTIHPAAGAALSEYTMDVDWVRVWQ